MRLNNRTFQQHKSLAGNVLVVSGDEWPLLDDASNRAKSMWSLQPEHTQKMIVDSDTANLIQVIDFGQQDIFSEHHCYQLTFLALPNKSQQQQLLRVITELPPQIHLIIRIPKITASDFYQPWLRAVDEKGCIVQIWPLSDTEFLAWLSGKAQVLKLPLTQHGLQQIAKHTRGNLIAARNVLMQLHLLNLNQAALAQELPNWLNAQAQSDIFKFLDAVFNKQAEFALHTLYQLKKQQEEPIIILWWLQKEFYILSCLQSSEIHQRTSVLKSLKVAEFKQRDYLQRLPRWQQPELLSVTHALKEIEFACKGICNSDPWMLFERLIVNTQQSELCT